MWATWCEACAREFGALARLHEATRDVDAAVIAVAVGEPHAEVAGVRPARGRCRGPSWSTSASSSPTRSGRRRVPATLVLDRQGRIVYRGGAFDEGALAAFRRALAAGGGDAQRARAAAR